MFYALQHWYYWTFHRSRMRWVLSPDFYKSPQWLQLRYRVLRYWVKRIGRKCMLCRRTHYKNGKPITLHVDHIKPRSLFPWLALKFSNCQILCYACNIGKSNKYRDDWRE